MNIIIVNDFAFVNGGAGQVALSSAIGLANNGFNVMLFTAVGPISPDLECKNLKVICTNQYDILNDNSRLRAIKQGIWNIKAGRLFAEILDKMNTRETIIHVHGWSKALSSSIIRTALERNMKIIVSLHDYFAVCPNGGFFDYQKGQICKKRALSFQCWQSNCDSRSYVHKQWRFFRQIIQERFGMMPSGIKHFIAISDFSRRIIEPYLPADSNIYTISNPIDINKSDPVKVDQNKSYISVGRLSLEKGPLLFCKAANQTNCDAIFVGDGNCKNNILRINPKSKVTGWLDRKGVYQTLKKARALVFPSLLYEVQGLVVLEAAAMGIPAIVPDLCAARDFVIDGISGLWFRSGDEHDLAAKIKMLEDDSLVASMGLASYQNYWSRPYTMKNHISNLINVYTKVLNSN